MRETKAGLWRKIRGAAEIKEESYGRISLAVARLPYTAEGLAALSPARRAARLARAEAGLRARGVQGVVADRRCTPENREPGPPPRVPIPREMFGACVDFALTQRGREILDGAAYLLDPELEYLDYPLLVRLCRRVRYLCLLTRRREQAEALGERLCREYGVCPQVTGPEQGIPARAALAADWVRRTVRIGRDCIIDGAEPLLEIPGYDLDPGAVLNCLPALGEKLPVKFWLSGKKRLTT